MYTQPENRSQAEKFTLATLAKMKAAGEKITCLTAYDASFAALLDNAGVDLVLVGDSLGNVIQGHATTVPVSMDDMVYHSRLVERGLKRAFFMVDMPFMSYPTPEIALSNAARLMQEGGAQMVKLEGSGHQAEIVQYLSENGVPVCAHLGLRPQNVHKLGGLKVQGRSKPAARKMLADALLLEKAGADIILLELIPRKLAAEITAKVKVPVIGIGAGANVDGQILVLYDMLDITPGRRPRFARNFMDGAGSPHAAVEAYVKADSVASLVTAGTVPASRPLAPATAIPFSAAVLRSSACQRTLTRLHSMPPPQRLYAAARTSHLAPQTPRCYVRCGYRRFLASGFALPWLVKCVMAAILHQNTVSTDS